MLAVLHPPSLGTPAPGRAAGPDGGGRAGRSADPRSARRSADADGLAWRIADPAGGAHLDYLEHRDRTITVMTLDVANPGARALVQHLRDLHSCLFVWTSTCPAPVAAALARMGRAGLCVLVEQA